MNDVINLPDFMSATSLFLSALISAGGFLAVALISRLHSFYMLLSTLMTFALVLFNIFNRNPFPSDAFCIGTTFLLTGKLPCLKPGVKTVSILVSCFLVLIMGIIGIMPLALFTVAYFFFCFHAEFISISSETGTSDEIFRGFADYPVLAVYSFSVIAVSVFDMSTASIFVSELRLVLSWALYAIVLYCLLHKGTLVLSRTREKNIRDMVASVIRVKKKTGPNERELKMPLEVIYSKFLDDLEEHESFTDPELSINKEAKRILTNKTYLSRSISIVGKTSFPEILNEKRVRYAMKLFAENNHLKVAELARMSGFGSDSHFSVAFRKVVGMSPKKWCDSIKFGTELQDIRDPLH